MPILGLGDLWSEDVISVLCGEVLLRELLREDDGLDLKEWILNVGIIERLGHVHPVGVAVRDVLLITCTELGVLLEESRTSRTSQ